MLIYQKVNPFFFSIWLIPDSFEKDSSIKTFFKRQTILKAIYLFAPIDNAFGERSTGVFEKVKQVCVW